jgi:hypothetical protein
MTARLKGRRREVGRFLHRLSEWAGERRDVIGVALVGSYARNQPRMGSDVDVVMLVVDPVPYTLDVSWFWPVQPRAELIRSATWGALLERRFRLPSGLHVEMGIVRPDWARVPLDPGTRRVLADGHRILIDRHEILSRATETLTQK